MKLTKDLEHIIDHTRELWDDMRGKTIFVTGGTGFFGKWILESFIYANETLGLDAKMIVLSRKPADFISAHPQYDKPFVRYVAGDIVNFEFPAERIDYIIHAATDMSGYQNIDQSMAVYDSIVEGTKRVLELARQKQVKAILHTGSGAVYGVQPHNLTHIPETYTGAPDVFDKGAAYGEGKRVAEMLANVYYHKYGVPSKVARCFAFVGPYLPLDAYAIGNFIRDAINGNKIIIKGDGTPYRSYMYAADLAIWMWQILVHGKVCRPYNLGSEADLNLEEVAKTVASLGVHGNKGVEIMAPKTGQPASRYVPDVKRAKEELNLSVHIGLEEAIRRTIEYYK